MMSPRKRKRLKEEQKLPPLPPREDAEAALAHAEEVYAQTPEIYALAKETADIFADTIMKAIAQKG